MPDLASTPGLFACLGPDNNVMNVIGDIFATNAGALWQKQRGGCFPNSKRH
jgi:hypothetical protein